MAFMLIACTAFAQITRMTGVVLSAEDDEPILGATVRVTGSKNTTATDINGKFTLTNLKPTDRTITVTFVGMEPQTVKIAPEVTIKLKTSSKVMDEVVVVAFGKQKREAFTGSAGVLKGENLTLQQANDPISALEGKVSGVSIVSGNDPTAEPEITIEVSHRSMPVQARSLWWTDSPTTATTPISIPPTLRTSQFLKMPLQMRCTVHAVPTV